MVVVFDDIHWGEPTFLDLIEHVADWSRDAPILLLCLARPDLLEVRPGWGGGKTERDNVLLEPLAEDECGELIEHLLGERLAARAATGSSGRPRATPCSSRRCFGC